MTRKIYASGNESFHNFYDVTLSLIAWNLLSNVCTSIFNFKDSAFDKNSFQSVSKTASHNTKNIYSVINKTLHYWDNLLQKQQKCESALLRWDEGVKENFSENDWGKILRLWEKFFSTFSSNNQDILCELWEYIEKYFVADYNNENVHMAPAALISSMTQYLEYEGKEISVYDPYARTGNLLAEAQRTLTGVKEITGTSSTRLAWKLATIRLLFTGVRLNIHLSTPDTDIVEDKMINVILSNPPYGDSRDNINISIQDKHLSTIARKSKRLEVIFLSHMLDRLTTDGRAAILLPYVFLTGGSTVKNLMEYILQQNILDIVVELPQGLFEHTAIAPVLFCFNKKREINKNIVLINAINEVSKSGRQLNLNEKILSRWIQQIGDGNIPDGKKIIQVAPDEAINGDYNFYKLLHRHEKKDNKEWKSAAKLLAESEELQNNLVCVQQEIAALIQNYNN
jgi:type I restriction enzyme M protein